MNYETHIPNELGSGDFDAAGEEERLLAARRKRILQFAAIGAAIILLYALWAGYSRVHNSALEAPAPEVPNVTVLKVSAHAVTSIVSGTGAIAAKRDMPVSVVGEGGRVLDVLVEPGAWVRAGQTLATIERSVQSEQTASLAAQVEVARANAKLAEANLTRARGLVGNGFISKADLDTRIANRDGALAQLNVAIAQLNQSKATMARLDVRAPADGLVLTRTVEPGQVVSSGSGVLFRIAMKGEMEMRLAVNEADLPGVGVGSKAQVLPVGSHVPVTGTVWQVSPIVDPTTRQGAVRILLHYDPSLRPGGFAHATVATGTKGGFVLPEAAVQSDDRGNFVYVVDAKSRVQRRPVVTGQVADTGVSITKGLNGGETLVATAGGFLNPGDLVKPVHATADR